jgi:cytochrome c peroxidase
MTKRNRLISRSRDCGIRLADPPPAAVSSWADERRTDMKSATRRYNALWCAAIVIVAVTVGGVALSAQSAGDPMGAVFTVGNEFGQARTINGAGFPVVATDNPFSQQLGINGRNCGSCHQPETNMTVTPAGIQARFEATGGADPIFRINDGSNSPLADVSTVEARRIAYSMLLEKGVIRVGLAILSTAEFELVDVQDPYGFASGAELSLFR